MAGDNPSLRLYRTGSTFSDSSSLLQRNSLEEEHNALHFVPGSVIAESFAEEDHGLTDNASESDTGAQAHAPASLLRYPPPPTTPLPTTTSPATSMLFDGAHPVTPHVEIVLPSDTVVMRGVGQNVEPALLSGSVVLTLHEPTNIREICLSFTGKARLPHPEGRQTSVASLVTFCAPR